MPQEIKTPAGRLTFFTGEILKTVDDRIERAMRQTVILVENRVKVLQTGARHGRMYRIGKVPTKENKAMGLTYRAYRASAPGEPPAIKSSRLFKSITSRVEPIASGMQVGWKGSVGTNVPYARPLEFGVKAGGKKAHATVKIGPKPPGGWRLAPRPLWRRALTDLMGEIKKIWAVAAGSAK